MVRYVFVVQQANRNTEIIQFYSFKIWFESSRTTAYLYILCDVTIFILEALSIIRSQLTYSEFRLHNLHAQIDWFVLSNFSFDQ